MSYIETQRLILRTWMLPRDLDDAAEMCGDPEVMAFTPGGALDRAGAEQFVAQQIQHEERHHYSLWPMMSKEDRELVGACGLLQMPDGADVSIAWILKRRHWGKGYVTEAASAVLRYAFDELHLSHVYALIARENSRSIAIANRLLMRYDRVVRVMRRDLMRYVAERTVE